MLSLALFMITIFSSCYGIHIIYNVDIHHTVYMHVACFQSCSLIAFNIIVEEYTIITSYGIECAQSCINYINELQYCNTILHVATCTSEIHAVTKIETIIFRVWGKWVLAIVSSILESSAGSYHSSIGLPQS